MYSCLWLTIIALYSTGKLLWMDFVVKNLPTLVAAAVVWPVRTERTIEGLPGTMSD